MKITLKDGSVKEYNESKSVIAIATDISEGLARVACAGEVNGELVDLRTVLSEDCELNIVTVNDPAGLQVIRHTASHVMAEAVKRLFPEAKVAIGPAIEDGFYYDFDNAAFSREDLDAIEAEMKKIIKEGHEITRFTLPREEAIKYMQEKGEPYKVELIEDLPEGAEISFYDQGGFVDLCAGPHLMNTKGIKAYKLISSSMAYWRGDSDKARLQRIYATAFNKKEDLQAHLEKLEDAKNRDHNKLGREMGLFTTVDVIGQGLPLFTPKGTKMIMKLQRWIEDLEDKEVMALRPMTCPFQYYVYMNEQHSYRDLPYRMAETSTLFRNEDSGEMHGLTRVRQFTITEAHIILTPEQAEEELTRCTELCHYIMTTLGIDGDVTYRLSKWDPSNKTKYLGDEAYWNSTQQYLRDVMDKNHIPYTEADGEAAFYGPKIDIQAKNVYGKEDTMVTIQLDCASAEKFGMYYIDENGNKALPWIIHRTSMGCYERTLAWLIEHYAGKFPTWLCPEQVRVLPISEKYIGYANTVAAELKKNGVDCTIDERAEKIGYKIREARLDKLPYMLVVGAQEEVDHTVSVRSRFAGDEGIKSLDEFIEQITKEIRTKEIRKEIPLEEREQK